MVATGSPERITEWGSGSGLNILRTLFNLILNNSLAIIIPVLQMKKRDSEIEQFSLTSQAALMWRTKLKTQVCLTANTTILNYLFVMSVKFKINQQVNKRYEEEENIFKWNHFYCHK